MVKHIVCFGDSNTHGYFPNKDGKGFGRFDENQRWTRLLQKNLGEGYLVFEEGLTGRTTAFDDPMRENMNGLRDLYCCMMSHEPVDLLIIMLGTNDVKDRFGADADTIAGGMEQLIKKAKSISGWQEDKPRILLIAPPHISKDFNESYHLKSVRLAQRYAALAVQHGCSFLDLEGIGEFNQVDYMHLTQKSHERIGERLGKMIRDLLET